MNTDALPGKVKETLDIWKHNRQVYPGWLLLPTDGEREKFRMRTDNWEGHILASLPAFTVVERLNAIYELTWRREILLEPISKALELAAEDALESVDCQDRTVVGIAENEIHWSTVREVWREVALTLVTAARFCFDKKLFDRRTDRLKPFASDHSDVHNRLCQENCLWAMYSLDFETLENLLDDWSAKNCDPIWMVRKAALLWETDRSDEAANLITDALETIRDIPGVEGSVARESREGWAMWSAVTINEWQEFRKRWHELAALKCDAELEKDLIARRLEGDGDEQEAPIFDLESGRGEGIRFSSTRPELAAYRAIRLSEVAGLPPASNHGEPIGLTVASDILRSAADSLALNQPEFAIRLVLRVSTGETDKTLNRVLSRTRAATLSEASVEILSDICIDVIDYASPRLVMADGHSRSLPWITRMRVAIEVLSRLALRVTSERAEDFLNIGLQCIQNHRVAQEFWLYKSLDNLLRRTWGALPKDRRAARAVDLLSFPIPGIGNFTIDVADLFPDPAILLQSDDLSSVRTPENDGQWSDTVNFLVRGLEGEAEARKRALGRIMTLFDAELLTESELSAVAQALWSERHTAPDSLPAGTHLPDWVFLWLPEPAPGTAEMLFRRKWLSGDINRFDNVTQSDTNSFTVSWGTAPANPDKPEDVLWNVGTAIAALRNYGIPLQLSDNERRFLTDLVEHWIAADFPSHTVRYFQAAARQPTVWALRGLIPILTEVAIPQPVGDRLFEKLRKLSDSGTPCFELIHSLAKVIPARNDELVIWLRIGLASIDESLAGSALLGLHSWLGASAETEESFQSPPEDLLREVGFKIASRSNVALPQALQLATWVFREGTSEHRQILNDLAALGLRYLAEELAYDYEHNLDGSVDLPLLRWLCVELRTGNGE